MFLGRVEEARAEYLAHRSEEMEYGRWDALVINDFADYRKVGRERPLMAEIEELFKTLPRKP
jgi:hypothetical protein